MLKSAKEKIINIDLFGKTMMFEENGSQKYNTILGNITTFLLFITCLTIGFMFGQEIYLRQTPIVINSDEKLQNSRIETKDYPIFFGFSYSNSTAIKNIESIFDFVVTRFIVKDDLSTNYNITYGLRDNCDPDDYDELYRPMIKSLYTQNSKANNLRLFCIHKEGLYIQNEFSTWNSSSISIRVEMCKSHKRSCHPQLEAIVNDAYITIATFDAVADPKNYTNPVSYFTNMLVQQLNTVFFKRNYITTQVASLETNEGWLIDNIVKKEYITRKAITKDLNPVINGSIFSMTFESTNVRSRIIRNYMKIQDLLAKIGGFFNALLIICYLLTTNYVDFNYYTSLYDIVRANIIKQSNPNFSSQSQKFSFDINEKKLFPSKVDASSKKINLINMENLNQSDQVNIINKSKTVTENNFVKQVYNNNSSSNQINPVEKSNINVEVSQIKKCEVKNAEEIVNNETLTRNNEMNKVSLISNKFLFDANMDKECNLTSINSKNNYFYYVWNDLICCGNAYTMKIKSIKNILSFNNIVNNSYKISQVS